MLGTEGGEKVGGVGRWMRGRMRECMHTEVRVGLF